MKVDQSKLLDIMSDIDGQPDWRSAANKADAYYDDDQLEAEVLKILKERGQPITIQNLIKPAVNSVLGMEAKTRTDLLVMADDPDDEMEELAEALNAEFSDACRLGRLDKARSDAYASQLKSGLGWVECFRNPDPFGAKYKIQNVPRDEVYWDWLAKQHDLSDARWLMRYRWIDMDELITMVPNKRAIIEQAVNSWNNFVDVDHIAGLDPQLQSGYKEHSTWTRSESEWLSQNRKRIRLQVIYYRNFERKPVIELSDGRVIEYQSSNIAHTTAVGMGKVQLRMAQINRISESWYAGPHHLGDKECSAPQGMWPLIPFFGYRKASSGEPYGIVASSISAQDEVNFRRSKLTQLLQSPLIIMDEDATNMSTQKVIEEIDKRGVVKLNPNRRNQKTMAEVFQINRDTEVSNQQFSVMQDSMRHIQDVMGVSPSFLGQDDGAKSGIAIANIVEQGATTLAEINDNYRFACQLVGELILGYVIEDLKSKRNKTVVVNRDDKMKRKTVVINEETNDGMNNDISRLRSHIALAPVQQTSAYKSQLAERMMQMTSQLPPEVQSAVIDLVLELSDVPNKAEFMDRVRDALGVGKDVEDMTPEEQQAAEAQAQQEQEQQALMMRELAAKVDKLEAEAQRTAALANKESVVADSQRYANAKTQAETGKILTEMEKVSSEVGQVKQNMLVNLQQQIDSMEV
ncbi:portal protein [Photobacterium kishitanii]|uniref:portal protein n=1 Tax=Photobacterium kishitanii TaxID=318456 RepID=UPI000D15B3A5|nr:portal protein [Photobacterium kishitanii]PSV11662.1 portal protein [Photobacterium kishitanii]